ncbi:MAG: type II secretion system protein GspM [bacterium]
MFPTVSIWWTGLSGRERLLLSVGFVVALAAAVIVGVWQPLRDNKVTDEARLLRYERTLTALAMMPMTAKPLVDIRPIATIVTESAATQGLSILRLDTPKPDTATVTLQDAPFETLLLWIDGLNRDGGVNVASATIRRAGEIGSVSADLVLVKVAP